MKKLIYLIQFLIIPAPLFFFNLFELKLNNELFVNLLNNYAIFSAFTPIIATFLILRKQIKTLKIFLKKLLMFFLIYLSGIILFFALTITASII